MRVVAAALTVATIFAGSATAQAERRIFIIPNNATGGRCGAVVANAYCQARDFAQAASFRNVERGEITGAVPSNSACTSEACDQFVAIECSR